MDHCVWRLASIRSIFPAENIINVNSPRAKGEYPRDGIRLSLDNVDLTSFELCD